MTVQKLPIVVTATSVQVAPLPLVTYTPDGYYRSPLFWACNCPDDYVHPQEEDMCPVCGYTREGAPRASFRDIVKYVTRENVRYTPSVGLMRELLTVIDDTLSIPF